MQILRHHLLKMISDGSMKHLLYKWMKKPRTCIAEVDREDLALGYDKVLSLFLVLAIGFILASLICLCERVRAPRLKDENRNLDWITEKSIKDADLLLQGKFTRHWRLKRKSL